jgi:hypothetical protein
MLHKKIHLTHNSERARPGVPILGSFLLWNPASIVEKKTASVVLIVGLPFLHHPGKLSLLAHQHVI